MADYKEISDLGIDTSKQYAQYDLIKESSSLDSANIVRIKAQVDTTKPILTSSSSALFQLDKRNAPFGEMEPPKDFELSQNRAFANNVIPSIGNADHIAGLTEALTAHEKELTGPNQEGDLDELNQLKQFTGLLFNLEKDFTSINNERIRLQRG
jgi:hypothetical protein